MKTSSSEGPVLSVCIPTYNRCKLVNSLACSILKLSGDFEVCIHIDGSSDDTDVCLTLIKDERLKVSISENRGRAQSIASLIADARGEYVMIYDDDDCLYEEGLEEILRDCSRAIEDDVAGYIYHMNIGEDFFVRSHFQRDRSNLLKLRADEGVTGDKKEVIKTEIFKTLIRCSPLSYRRVPTSMFWALIALDYDVICRNISVGRKDYLDGGMTNSIQKLKVENAYPMYFLHLARCRGYMRRRYSSVYYFLRSTLAMPYYRLLSLRNHAKSWLQGNVLDP